MRSITYYLVGNGMINSRYAFEAYRARLSRRKVTVRAWYPGVECVIGERRRLSRGA
jgi:hypothetical protein